MEIHNIDKELLKTLETRIKTDDGKLIQFELDSIYDTFCEFYHNLGKSIFIYDPKKVNINLTAKN